MITPIKKRIIFDEGYVNHVDLAEDAAGNLFVIGAVEILRGDKKHVDAIVKRRLWGSNVWETIAVFDQREYGKNGYGSITIVGTTAIVAIPQRQPDETTNTIEYHLAGVASTIERIY